MKLYNGLVYILSEYIFQAKVVIFYLSLTHNPYSRFFSI